MTAHHLDLAAGLVVTEVCQLPWLLLPPSPVPHSCAVCVAGADT